MTAPVGTKSKLSQLGGPAIRPPKGPREPRPGSPLDLAASLGHHLPGKEGLSSKDWASPQKLLVPFCPKACASPGSLPGHGGHFPNVHGPGAQSSYIAVCRQTHQVPTYFPSPQPLAGRLLHGKPCAKCWGSKGRGGQSWPHGVGAGGEGLPGWGWREGASRTADQMSCGKC